MSISPPIHLPTHIPIVQTNNSNYFIISILSQLIVSILQIGRDIQLIKTGRDIMVKKTGRGRGYNNANKHTMLKE